MNSVIRISIIILSAILISSCATNRIQVSRKIDLACKTPGTRYDLGRKKPIRAIKSDNRKFNRYVYRTTRNKTHNGYSSKKITKRNEIPEKPGFGSGETINFQFRTYYSLNELMLFQEILNSTEINLNNYELKKLPVPSGILNEPKDFINSPSQEELLFQTGRISNGYDNTHLVLKGENRAKIKPDESIDEAGVSIPGIVNSDQTQKTPFQKSETYILMLAVLAGLIPLATIKASPNLAANISFWAAMNPWKTRLMFAGIQIGLGSAAFLLGEKLAYNGIHFSNLSRDMLLGAFLTSSLLYPVKHAPISFLKHSYLRQKAFDMALAISGFMLMVNAGNDPGMRASFTSLGSFKGHEQQKVNMLNDKSQAPKQLLYYQNDKQVQYEQIAPRKKEASKGLKILYTILTVLGALALVFLSLAAACSLSCNGLEGLAYIVGIGGSALVVGLTILVIKSIWHPKRAKRIRPSEGSNPIRQESAVQI